ncbi:MAG: ABC transporter ATP-binding protein, partial [Gammaproteobacteria bacterium]|nr:ABC transporter ATP-binding protein [Gammaproteobacteria bacterium]
MNAISLRGLGKSYAKEQGGLRRLREIVAGRPISPDQQIEVLKEIDLDIPMGQVVGIIGRNGAGKSTLLKVVAGMVPHTAGSMEVSGRVAALLELGSGFHPEMTGRENVYLAASLAGLKRDEIDEKYESIVTFSGIQEFIDRPVKTYSSGMMVRLAFSVATSVDPDILIIDEALSVGDGIFSRKSFERIMEFKEKKKTIL